MNRFTGSGVGAFLALQLAFPAPAVALAPGAFAPPPAGVSQQVPPAPQAGAMGESAELPARAVIRAFLHPTDDVLRLLLRMPIDVMRDADLPIEGPGYLVLDGIEPFLEEAGRSWIENHVRFYAGRTELEEARIVATRVSLPSDRSFDDYGRALDQLLAGPPLAETTQLFWRQGLFDLLVEYPIEGASGGFAVRPDWHELAGQTIGEVTILSPDGEERVISFTGDPGLIRLDPGVFQVAWQFVGRGFVEELRGIEALLLLLLLVVPFRRVVPAVAIVASFAVGHTITLVAGATGIQPSTLWFPQLIATLTALSVVYVGFENIIGPEFRRRWPLAFVFGLAHGFAFWFPLEEALQFAGSQGVVALGAFNVGIVLAQVMAVAVAIPLLEVLFRRVVAERVGTILLSALIAHSAWHWMLDRGAALREYQFQPPLLNLAFVAGLMRWLILLLVATGAAWLLVGLFERIPGWAREQRGGPDGVESGATADSAG